MASDITAAERQPGGGTAHVFPLFDPQKRKEIMQQNQSSSKPKKSRGARAVTPTSLSDNEKGELEIAAAATSKPKKPRSKTAAAKGKPKLKRQGKEDPDGDFPSPGSGALKSTKRVSALITETSASIPTLLTPTSSPPRETSTVEDGDMIDSNQGRRKRRKKTPTVASAKSDEEDVDTDFLPPPSTQAEVPASDIGDTEIRPLVIQQYPNPKFVVEVPAEETKELLLRPSLQNAFKVLMQKRKEEIIVVEDELELSSNTPEVPAETYSSRRTPAAWDSSTGILIIRSNPIILAENPPPVRSASNPLGRKGGEMRKRKKRGRQKENDIEKGKDMKEEEEIPELSLPEPSLPETSRKAASGENKKTTAKFDAETGILTIRSSPIIAPHSPEFRSKNALSLLGKKKESHPPAQEPPPFPQPPLPTVTIRQEPKKVMASQPTKTMHPFFQPGGLKKVPNAAASLLAAETQSDIEDIASIIPQPSTQPGSSFFGPILSKGDSRPFGGGSSLGSALSPTSNRILRTPGLADALWPSRDNYHIRGLSASPLSPLPKVDEDLPRPERKLKDRAVVVSPDEDLLLQYSRRLSIHQQKQQIRAPDYDVRRYYDVPSDVRLPQRIITTGSKLQEMVRKRVSARLPHPNAFSAPARSNSDDESAGSVRKKVHPTLIKLYNRMRDELTPFDKSECESSSWGVKYAPESSQEVIQVGKETQILRDWLVALKVESVGVSSDKKNGKRKSRSSTPGGAGGKGGAVKKKRKKKDNELSGFIVDSDEERDEMDEITDPEDSGWMPAPSGVKKSIMRAGDRGIESTFGGLKESGKFVNAVIISGPNGCGKTAAVYAIAKEVGFTVFEVSPGTRRSGKDILDQVGEMSRTHLVHQAKAATLEGSTSFFKPKSVQKLQVEEDAPKIASVQQQSLILLEEVDLLFEEDKQFWSTVLTLMAQSKRPIILTCNDENLLPLDTLPLHAILRFTPPPRELIVDQLLLICANEGHLLQRDAIESLVKSHNGDVRACLVELEFWCRMGVGDRKGGLDWMIIRWPIGVDTAENGETLKVVSKDTYIKGMGWIDRAQTDENTKWRSIWETWEVDVGGEDGGMGKLKKRADAVEIEGTEEMMALRVCDEYAEAMSAVDCYAGGNMRNFDEAILDTTQPALSSKVKIDDPQGYSMLQTDPVIRAYSVGAEMAISARLLARKYIFGSSKQSFKEQELVDIIADRSRIKQELGPLSRQYLSETFCPLSYASTIFALTPAVCHSSVNGPPSVLMLDVAPYVRDIVRYDVRCEQERIKTSSLLSAGGGGKPEKRRVTRTARVAEKGGDRRRKERWFTDINAALVEGSSGKWGHFDVREAGGGSVVLGVEIDEEGNIEGGMDSDEDGEYELESE